MIMQLRHIHVAHVHIAYITHAGGNDFVCDSDRATGRVPR